MLKQNDIQNEILEFAKGDNRIRAVILNGSRANSNVNPDKYQDFDVVFIVKNFDSFLNDRNWINVVANGRKRTKAISVRQVLYVGADETASSQLKI